MKLSLEPSKRNYRIKPSIIIVNKYKIILY